MASKLKALLPGMAAGDWNATVQSQFGLVLYDTEALANQGVTGTAEETWLDTNATPVLVNRYNGTLLRAEAR